MFKPYLTEKSVDHNAEGVYVYEIPMGLSKQKVKEMLEKVFKIEITKINTLIVKGKVKRFKGRLGERKSIRKAVITLAKGQKIAGFEGDVDEEKKEKKAKKEVKA